MKKTIRNYLLLGLILWTGIGSIYIGLPLSARIVDARTGIGIGGAQVVAYWSASRIGAWSVGPGGALEIKRTKTDADGKFRFAGWAAWHRWWMHLHAYELNDPIIWVFTPGYLPMWMNNRRPQELALPPSTRWGPVLWSRWRDAALPLFPADHGGVAQCGE